MKTDTNNTHDLLDQYAAAVTLLREAIAGLTDTTLDIALDEQGWTIRQIIHHVADGDDLWKTCIKATLGNSEPFSSMNWYLDIPQDNWAEMWVYAQRELEPSLNLLQANHDYILHLLRLIPNALDREVVRAEGDEQKATVRDMIKIQVLHVADHVAEINQIRAAHGLQVD